MTDDVEDNSDFDSDAEVEDDHAQPEPKPAPLPRPPQRALEIAEHPEDPNLMRFVIITKDDKKYNCPEKLIKESKVIQSNINSLKVDTLKSSEITSGDLYYIYQLVSKDKLTVDDLPHSMDYILRMIQVSYLLGLEKINNELCQFTSEYIDFQFDTKRDINTRLISGF
ncbi:MAG: hypothetical protein WCT13_06330 [Patescibacteria group bacterium]